MGNIGFNRENDQIPENDFRSLLDPFPNTFSAVVINVAWWQLEPAPGVFNFSSIDSPLAFVEAYNANISTINPLAVKLRVWAGDSSPLWIKTPMELNQQFKLFVEALVNWLMLEDFGANQFEEIGHCYKML